MKRHEQRTIRFDHPRQNEAVRPGHYAFRIRATNPGTVVVSVDGGPWQACRDAVGYWWYDWAGDGPGKHRVVARVTDAQGSVQISPARAFRVEEQATVAPKGVRVRPGRALSVAK